MGCGYNTCGSNYRDNDCYDDCGDCDCKCSGCKCDDNKAYCDYNHWCVLDLDDRLWDIENDICELRDCVDELKEGTPAPPTNGGGVTPGAPLQPDDNECAVYYRDDEGADIQTWIPLAVYYKNSRWLETVMASLTALYPGK